MAYDPQSQRLGNTNEAAPATDTAAVGLNGRLQRIAQRLTSIIGLLTGTAGNPATNVISVQSPLSNLWRYAGAAGGVVSTADVAAKAAGGTGVVNYVRSAQFINSHPTIGTEVVIKDGATVMWRGWCEPAGGGCAAVFDPPLKGTANTAINVAELTATATTGVVANLQGFTGA